MPAELIIGSSLLLTLASYSTESVPFQMLLTILNKFSIIMIYSTEEKILMARPNKLSQAEREERHDLLAQMYVKGYTQAEMAAELGLVQSTINKEIRKMVDRWAGTKFEDLDRYKSEQLHRINMMESELWEAWEKSKTARKVIVNKSKSGELLNDVDAITGRPIKVQEDKYWKLATTEEEATGGDMQYMNGIMWCVSERSKILGINAPKKVAQTDPSGAHEAASAKEILGDIIGGILKRSTSSEIPSGSSAYAENKNDGGAEHHDDTPELAQRLKMERMKRLPSSTGIQFDEEGNILVNAEHN